jgi:aspartate/methionine/tyrosine aminotransferase
MIAKRLQKFDSSAIRHAFELAAEIPNPIDLSIGYPEDNTPDYIKAAAIKAINENFTQYTPSDGMFELRSAIAEKLTRENKIATDADHVTVTPGVTTGILLTYLAILDPGDEILIPDPYFPPYKDLAIMVGAKPVYVDTYPDFQLTAEKIKPLINRRTKALLINSPNNPTGAVYPTAELKKIAQLAKDHDILLISDEIYEHFNYDIPHFSVGSIYPKTITLNGFSKAYAMTGWRVGYIAGPVEVIQAINELQQYIVFSSSSISQKAAMAAFRHSPVNLTNKYREKRDITVKKLGTEFKLQGSQGAFYAFVKLPKGINDLEYIDLAAKQGVIILPSRAFSTHKDYVRIAFAANKTTLLKGLRVICELNSRVKAELKTKADTPKRSRLGFLLRKEA